jgi:hypothetical protein
VNKEGFIKFFGKRKVRKNKVTKMTLFVPKIKNSFQTLISNQDSQDQQTKVVATHIQSQEEATQEEAK